MTIRQRRLRAVLVRLGFWLGRLTPIRRRVVLATAHTDRLSGNLRLIREGLAADAPDVPVVVLARAVRHGPRGLVRAALDAVVAGWHLATARLFVVDDHYAPMSEVNPRPGTTRAQVWHACGAFKRFGYSLEGKAFGSGDVVRRDFPVHRNYDLCLVSAAKFAPFYAEAFGQPLDRFTARLGIPRTDTFFDERRKGELALALRDRYGIAPGRRVVLYAPTFRGEDATAATSPHDLDFAGLQAALGDDHVVLLRVHPFVAARARLDPALARFVIDVSAEPELNDLMPGSDVLVTDYSSAIYEFALLERPIAFFAPDHAAYERERGFYLRWPDDLPGPVFESTEGLAAWLRAGAFDVDAVRRFKADSFDVADGRATPRFIEQVVLPALGEP
jgi:CDP-glycerol glycerophosphotransferase (TagB/SpsB family)